MVMSFQQYADTLYSQGKWTKAQYDSAIKAGNTPGYNQYQYNQSGGSQGQDYGVQADPSGSGKLVSKQTGNVITKSDWSTNPQSALGTAGVGGSMLGGQLGAAENIRYKPFSHNDGNLVVLSNYPGNYQIMSGDGRVLDTGSSFGPSNGYGNTVRFSKPGSAYGDDVYLKIGDKTFKVGQGGADQYSLRSVQGGSIANIGTTGTGAITSTSLGQGSNMAIDKTDYTALSGVQRAPFGMLQQEGRGVNAQGLKIPDSQIYNEAYIRQVLATRPDLPGANVGGTWYPNPSYQGPQQSVAGPAPAPAGGGGGGIPHGGGGGGGGGTAAPAVSPAMFEPREPLTHEVVRTGPKAETTQGQLVNVLDENGPIMRRAESRGMMIANNRGLINSSVAQGIAQGAVMEQAVPIAMSDANTFFTNSINNLNAENQFRAANNAAYLESILQAQQGEISKTLAHINGSYGIAGANIAARTSYMDMWLRMQMDPTLTGDMKSNLGGYVTPFINRPIFV